MAKTREERAEKKRIAQEDDAALERAFQIEESARRAREQIEESARQARELLREARERGLPAPEEEEGSSAEEEGEERPSAEEEEDPEEDASNKEGGTSAEEEESGAEEEESTGEEEDDEQDNGFEEAHLDPVGDAGDLHKEVTYLREKAEQQEAERLADESERARGLEVGAAVRVVAFLKEGSHDEWCGPQACQKDGQWEEIMPFSVVVVTETWSGDEDDPVKVCGDEAGLSYIYNSACEALHGVWGIKAVHLHAGIGESIEIGQVGRVFTPFQILVDSEDEEVEGQWSHCSTAPVWHWGTESVTVDHDYPTWQCERFVECNVREVGELGRVDVGTTVRVLQVRALASGHSPYGGRAVYLLVEQVVEDPEDGEVLTIKEHFRCQDTELECNDFDQTTRFDCRRCEALGGYVDMDEVEPGEVGSGCYVSMEMEHKLHNGERQRRLRSAVWLDASFFMPQF